MNNRIAKLFRYFIGALVLAIPTVLIFQNCGSIGLKANIKSVDASSLTSSASRGIVPLPKATSGELRAVFFVDNSRSMVQGICLGSLDFDALNPVVQPVNCGLGSGLTGVDHDRKRIKIIRQWIQELEDIYLGRPDLLAKVKMLILPFSGGSSQGALETRFSSLSAAQRFSSLAETKLVLDRMDTLQSVFSNEPNPPRPDPIGISPESANAEMGTSVPAAKLASSLPTLQAELELLKDKPGARFEYVFISDGVPKPRAEHIEAAAVQIWQNLVEYRRTGYCLSPPGPIEAPSDENPIYSPCMAFDYEKVGFDQCSNTSCRQAVRDWASFGTMTKDQETSCKSCIDALAKITGSSFFDQSQRIWGNSLDNTPQAIFRSIGKLKTQQDQYPDISYRFNFLRLDTLSPANFATPSIEKSPLINWETRAQDIYKNGHRVRLVNTPRVDFGLFPGLSQNESYKLDSIVALNINTRVNSVGVLDLDSDGDGLFDFEEAQLSLSTSDPQKARTNGVCLDSITFSLGCITAGCSPDIDSDGDSLNECEERTVGTTDQDFDSDGDGIPDSMEIIYGYNPMISDRDINSSADNIDNYEQWKMGVPGSYSVANTSPEFLTHVTAEFLGQKSERDSLNRQVLVPEYLFQIQNMKTTNSLSCQDIPAMYSSKARTPSTLLTDRFVGGAHAKNMNRIIVLGKVVSTQNIGDAYWIGKVVEISHERKDQTIDIAFDQLKPLKVVDPQDGGPP